MKPWRFWWTCPLLIFCGILFPGLARADGYLSAAELAYAEKWGYTICGLIATYPTEAGVLRVAGAVHVDGWDDESTADIVNASVHELCPEWWPLLEQIGRRGRHEMAV
jgi:hypothetical protein